MKQINEVLKEIDNQIEIKRLARNTGRLIMKQVRN